MKRSALAFAVSSLVACASATDAVLSETSFDSPDSSASHDEKDAGAVEHDSTRTPNDVTPAYDADTVAFEDASIASDSAADAGSIPDEAGIPDSGGELGELDGGVIDSGVADSGVTIDSCSAYMAAHQENDGQETRYCGNLSGTVRDTRRLEWTLWSSYQGGSNEHGSCGNGGTFSGFTSFLNKCCVRSDDTGSLNANAGFVVVSPHHDADAAAGTTIVLVFDAKTMFTYQLDTDLMTHSGSAAVTTIDAPTGLLTGYSNARFFAAMNKLGFGYDEFNFVSGGPANSGASGNPYGRPPTVTFEYAPTSASLAVDIQTEIVARSSNDTCVGKTGSGATFSYKATAPLTPYP